MLIHTRCPIDGTDDADVELYPANFDLARVTPDVFSARRMPDRMHYRMVRNRRTGCLRADPILDTESVLALYRRSTVNQESIEPHTTRTYAEYLKRALPHLPDKRAALEIGCASGRFLGHLRNSGFAEVKGFELSASAVEKADAEMRPHIIRQPLEPGLLPPESFSLACGFQVLDHLINPNETLQCCREVLTPGGVMFWICHDEGAPFARLLGERCPIIDIEHVVLYSKKTIAQLFTKNGFEVLDIFSVRNAYPLSYWLYLAPLPFFKKRMLGMVNAVGLGRWRISANFGNMGIIARKPTADKV